MTFKSAEYETGLMRTDRGLFWDKGNQVYDVRHPDFEGGAKGDGVTDDTKAIQAAVNNLLHGEENTGELGIIGVGGRLYFPAGVYVITAPIVVDSGLVTGSRLNNISFVGDGMLASTILNTDTSGGDAFQLIGQASNALKSSLFRDLGIKGNASSGNGLTIGTRVGGQMCFERFLVSHHGGHGYAFTTTNNNISFYTCRAHSNGGSGYFGTLNTEQVWFYGCSFRDNDVGLTISSNTNICNIYGGDIHGNRIGISVGGGELNPVSSLEFRGIYFEVNERDVVVTNVGSTNFSQSVLIAANSFSQTTPTDAGRYCIEVQRGQAVYIEHNEFRNITDANVVSCIYAGAASEDVYIGPNWFPASTTRPMVSIHASATRTWGYTKPDTDTTQFNAWGPVVADKGLALGSPTVSTLSTGALPLITGSIIKVAAESGTTDGLDFIEIPDEAGRMIILKADDGDTITINDNTGSPPSGYDAIQCAGSLAMDGNDHMTLYYDDDEGSGKWKELSRSVN